MRVLTVRQPWAWAIVHAGKDIENRSRNVAGAYRGAVAIHAAQTVDATAPAPLLRAWGAHGAGAVVGALIGVVDLVDVHGADACMPGEGARRPGTCSAWARPGAVHLVLANPRELARPVTARGLLGLWRLDPGLTARITDQLLAPVPAAGCAKTDQIALDGRERSTR